MINNISESALRVASKVDPSGAIHEKEVNQQKAKEVREARAIEKSDEGGKAEAKKPKDEEGSSKYLVNEKKVVFEKYDENGDLVLRLPPSQTPVDKVV